MNSILQWLGLKKKKIHISEIPPADLMQIFKSKRTVEQDTVQPERLNPETSNEWISWDKFPPPNDVKGLLIKYEDGFVDCDRLNPDKSRKFRESKIVGWKFMERSNPDDKSIQCGRCDSLNSMET